MRSETALGEAPRPPSTAGFQASDPGWREKVLDSIQRQGAMRTLGTRVDDLQPGQVTLRIDYQEGLGQQHGFFHGGVAGMLCDSACGYAAFSLMPAGATVLTVEYSLKLVAPAKGPVLLAVGSVIKPGRTLTFVAGEVFVETDGGARKLVAIMQATMMALHGRADVPAD